MRLIKHLNLHALGLQQCLIHLIVNLFSQTVDRLKLCTHRSQYTPNQPITELTKILEQLNRAFNGMLEKMYSKELRVS